MSRWYKPERHLAWRKIGDQILLHDEQRESHALRGTAVEIWDLIVADGLSTDAAVEALVKKYEQSDPQEIAADVQALLDELEERNFVVSSMTPVPPLRPV